MKNVVLRRYELYDTESVPKKAEERELALNRKHTIVLANFINNTVYSSPQ